MSPMLVTLLFHTAVASFRPTLSVSLTLSPPRKLKQLSRGYLEVVKTLFEDIHPACLKCKWVEELTWTWTWDPQNYGREITSISCYFCVEGICAVDGFAVKTHRRFNRGTTDSQWARPLAAYKEFMKNLWEALRSVPHGRTFKLLDGHLNLTLIRGHARCKSMSTSFLCM